MTTDAVERPRYIWGVQAIADEIGATKRQAFYLLEKGLLPATKVGNRWVANAAKLHAAIDREAA